jgi:hypothetical protein
MEKRIVYCSACDREVTVALLDETALDTAPAGGAGVCMDYTAEHCTGTMCALFDLPPREMLARLEESGLVPGGLGAAGALRVTPRPRTGGGA